MKNALIRSAAAALTLGTAYAADLPSKPNVYGELTASFDLMKSLGENAIGAGVLTAEGYQKFGKIVAITKSGYSFSVPVPGTPDCGCPQTSWTYSGGGSDIFTETNYNKSMRIYASFATFATSLLGNTAVDFAAYKFNVPTQIFDEHGLRFDGILGLSGMTAAKFGVNYGAISVGDQIAPGTNIFASSNTIYSSGDVPTTTKSVLSHNVHMSTGEKLEDAGLATAANAGATVVFGTPTTPAHVSGHFSVFNFGN